MSGDRSGIHFLWLRLRDEPARSLCGLEGGEAIVMGTRSVLGTSCPACLLYLQANAKRWGAASRA